MAEIRVRGAPSGQRPVVLHPGVVVPLDVIGARLGDQLTHLLEDPRARLGVAEVEHRRARFVVGHARFVAAVVAHQPRLAGHARLADRPQIDPLGLDPDPEPQAQFVSPIGERSQAVRKLRPVDTPGAQPGGEIERVQRAGALVPPGVQLEELGAGGGRGVHGGVDRRLVDVGAAREPGVVGDQRLEEAAAAQRADDEPVQRRRHLRLVALDEADDRVRHRHRARRRHAGRGRREPRRQLGPAIGLADQIHAPGARPHEAGHERAVRRGERDQGQRTLRRPAALLERQRRVLADDVMVERERPTRLLRPGQAVDRRGQRSVDDQLAATRDR